MYQQRPITDEDTQHLVDAKRANRHAFLATYPSGRHYVACGFPHPRRSYEAQCSVPWPHGGEHINRDGNRWLATGLCLACGHPTHQRHCNGWVSTGWTQHGCHCEESK